MDNKWYIIRCDRAGVFFGHIKDRKGGEATLTDVASNIRAATFTNGITV